MTRAKTAMVLSLLMVTACAGAPRQNESQTQKYSIQIVNQDSSRGIASNSEKQVIVKSCAAEPQCSSLVKSMKLSEFAHKLQKKIEIKSFVSQQISLLEQQHASLSVDRESLQNEVSELDRNLKYNRMSSLRGVSENIRRLRASLQIEIAELNQRIAMTEKDLQVLKSPVKNPGNYSLETAKLIEILELSTAFGASLLYRDNLIAQTLDSIARELI